ncbi:MAG: phosphoesterase, partial [Chlamydiia bacterium]|nr:phosphoesterase [Chlamydiia bacterium]
MRAFKWIFLCFPLVCFAITDKQFNEICQKQRRVSTNLVKSAVTGFDNEKSLKLSKNNGDQSRYADLRGNFNKALKHQTNGFPTNAAYSSLIKALTSGSPQSFLNIILGIGTVKLVNPQGSFAYSLAANDSWLNAIPPAPKFASNQAAAEMVEVYWTAVCRDVPFNMFATNAKVLEAIDDLNTLVDFYGPKIDGLVTPGTYLRGNTPGDLIGPYISQFFYQTVPYGSTTIPPEQTVPKGTTVNDFNTTFADWFTVINGGLTGATTDYDPVTHFIRTPRDLAAYVHFDAPGQVYYNALRILDSYGSSALDSNNPYRSNSTQFGFVSYGISQIFQLLTDAIAEALKAAWFHKWQVNRRLRPEEYGFYVQKQKADGMDLGIPSQLINSTSLDSVYESNSTYFLPQAYPEGCPT